MNKKEINEIKKNFSDDCGFFTINRVITAFVDAEKNIKCKTNQIYYTISQDDAELIVLNLKKVLSGSIGKNLIEYSFPKDAYNDDGSQQFLYKILKDKFQSQNYSDEFLNKIVEKIEYTSTYTIFSAHCTYSVLKKNKNDDFEDEADTDYNFLITAICPVNLRIDGLIYNEENNTISKKEDSDRVVELPSDGFIFPLFNDRMADINGVLYYTKNAKKPNISIIENFLECEFVMTGQSEKETFHTILNNVIGSQLDYNLITTVNEKIQNYIDQNANETEVASIDDRKLSSILWESGVSQEKLEFLPTIYKEEMGEKPLTALNIVDKKTVLTTPSITVNISKDAVDKVKTQVIDGKKCLIISLDDPEISINGLETVVE